jgi:hypothetical protein
MALNHIGKVAFHSPKYNEAGEDRYCDGKKRDRKNLIGKTSSSEQRPTKAFDQSSQRIYSSERPPFFGEQAQGVNYGGSEQPKLNEKWKDVPKITKADGKCRKTGTNANC